MRAYFDTSILATLVLEDEGWPLVLHWLTRSDPDVGISDFGRGEFASAVGIRVRSGRMTTDRAITLLAATDRYVAGWRTAQVTPIDIAAATELVSRFDLGLRLPDAIHIAIARRLSDTLMTADLRQASAARTLGIPVINPLEGSNS